MSIRLTDIAAERAWIALFRLLPPPIREQHLARLAEEAHRYSGTEFYSENTGDTAAEGVLKLPVAASSKEESSAMSALADGAAPDDGLAATAAPEIQEPDIPLHLIRNPDLRIIETLRRGTK